jgi:hypothetical protein
MLVKHIPPGERLLLLGDLRPGIEPIRIVEGAA